MTDEPALAPDDDLSPGALEDDVLGWVSGGRLRGDAWVVGMDPRHVAETREVATHPL